MRWPQMSAVFETFQKRLDLGLNGIVQAKGLVQMEQNGISCDLCLSFSVLIQAEPVRPRQLKGWKSGWLLLNPKHRWFVFFSTATGSLPSSVLLLIGWYADTDTVSSTHPNVTNQSPQEISAGVFRIRYHRSRSKPNGAGQKVVLIKTG